MAKEKRSVGLGSADRDARRYNSEGSSRNKYAKILGPRIGIFTFFGCEIVRRPHSQTFPE